VLCVAGEFKQGKSALVNALTGSDACHVDPVDSMPVPVWVHPAEASSSRVTRVVEGETITEETNAPDALRTAFTGGRGVVALDVGVVEPLPTGATQFLDTPGLGGLQPGRREALTAFLTEADALVLVTDASAELSGPELQFLRDSQDRCPARMVVLSKVDLYPEWRRIANIDRGWLAGLGIDAPVIPVSADLWDAARRLEDPELGEQSGIPELRRRLQAEVVARTTDRAAAMVLGVIDDALRTLAGKLDGERAALAGSQGDPAGSGALADAEQRLAGLRTRGARWATVLADRISDLSAEIGARLREETRAILRSADERWESSDPADDWPGFTAEVQTRVASLSTEISDRIADAASGFAGEIGALVGDAAPEIGGPGEVGGDLSWGEADRALPQERRRFSGVFTAVRGGSSGIITLGVVGSLAGFALAAPVSVGAGLVFGARQYVEDRRRAIDRRRREAQSALRQYLNVVQTDLGAEARRLAQETHRTLRDHFGARVAELDTEYRRRIEEARAALEQDEAGRQARLEHLDRWAEVIADLTARSRALGDRIPGAIGS
jgi:hypothetical protein